MRLTKLEVEACFIHSGLNTGPVVQGVFRVDGEQVLKRFVARNLRPIFPVAWNHVLAADVLKGFENQSVEDLDARPEIMQPNPVEVRNEQHEPEEDFIEYPDGAPPELIREMKEPDDTLALPRPMLKPPDRQVV